MKLKNRKIKLSDNTNGTFFYGARIDTSLYGAFKRGSIRRRADKRISESDDWKGLTSYSKRDWARNEKVSEGRVLQHDNVREVEDNEEEF